MEKCNFDRQFLSHSYLLNFSSNFRIPLAIKSSVFPTTQELSLYVKYWTPIIAHQSSITFFDTPCIQYMRIILGLLSLGKTYLIAVLVFSLVLVTPTTNRHFFTTQLLYNNYYIQLPVNVKHKQHIKLLKVWNVYMWNVSIGVTR